jgi:hypothetical protein
MAMLTFAPVVNTIAWSLISQNDLTYREITQFLSTEFIEFVGMAIVCFSYWNTDQTAMYFELCGYTTLSCAALWDVYFDPTGTSLFPYTVRIVIRRGSVHWGEASGLFLLGVVSIGKQYIHDEIHHKEPENYKKRDRGPSLDLEKSTALVGVSGGYASGASVPAAIVIKPNDKNYHD